MFATTPQVPGFSRFLILLGKALGTAMLGLLPMLTAAHTPAPIDVGMNRDMQEALGVHEVFGRWTSIVWLVYDPDDAPARYSSSTQVISLLEDAIYEWERVSGINIRISGTDRNAPDDVRGQTPGVRDGLVRVSWGNLGEAAGRAGPDFGAYDAVRGYYPYYDGKVELSSDNAIWHSDEYLVQVLVHELGHLLGLGHSDNPISIMYANPYNQLLHPREDDIRAVQVLYGKPYINAVPGFPLREWIYTQPAAASPLRTRYLFKANQSMNVGAHFAIDGDPAQVSQLTPTTAGDRLYLVGGIGNFDNAAAIAIDASLVVVDPSGYVQSKYDWTLSCPANTSCMRGRGIGRLPALKSVPGIWKFHVIDKSNNTTLLSMSLPVLTAISFNRPPEATVRATASAAGAVTVSIAANDVENHTIAALWHLPGEDGFVETLGADGVSSHTIDFGLTGTHTFFVQLVDSGPRYTGSGPGYSYAGDGFQTLLRITVRLPFTGADSDFEVATSNAGDAEYGGAGAIPEPGFTDWTVLQDVADALRLGGIITSNSSSTTAAFTLGASRDQGATTGTTFNRQDNLVIAGTATVQAADVGQAGAIFIVLRSNTAAGETWSYKDSTGNFRPWNTQLSGLQPAYQGSSLPASALVEVYSGTLAPGDHRVFIGYRLNNSTVLHYTSTAMRLTVAN